MSLKPKILLTDSIFPNSFGKWRFEEIKSFIEIYETDIMVIERPFSFMGIALGFDYEYMNQYCDLSDYNILIFDEAYNFLNKYNSRIDGTSFNGKFRGSYLFTKSDDFDLKGYDLVYHIFLMNYNFFNFHFNFDKFKQIIHLYPGGGFCNPSDVKQIDSSTHILSTNPNTSKYLRDWGYCNYIEVYGGTLLPLNYSPKIKTFNTSNITVCFSSLGNPKSKGLNSYLKIASLYKHKYPNDCVKFITIGNGGVGDGVVNYPPLPHYELDALYYNEVDIYLNTETGLEYNGWPIGGEALIQGCVQLSTDPHKSNNEVCYPKDSLIILSLDDLNIWVDTIHKLYTDNNILRDMSKSSQKFAVSYYSYKNQQGQIFEYINNLLNL
jgi:glycosyltransferase involved in cell wall biosynthesis